MCWSSVASETGRAVLLIATVAHSPATARAAPINFAQRTVGDDEAALAAIFDRFSRWQPHG